MPHPFKDILEEEACNSGKEIMFTATTRFDPLFKFFLDKMLCNEGWVMSLFAQRVSSSLLYICLHFHIRLLAYRNVSSYFLFLASCISKHACCLLGFMWQPVVIRILARN